MSRNDEVDPVMASERTMYSAPQSSPVITILGLSE
jgi:hypothetical protein